MNRQQFLRLLAGLGIACSATIASGQPNPTTKVLVGFPAGGAPDAVARAVAEQLRQTLGATVVVENKPGASGKIAIDSLLSSAADGMSIALVPTSVMSLVPQVLKSAKYDSVRDFVALGNVAEYGFGIAAGPSSKAVDVASFTAWAKSHASQSSYATPGPGTPQHFIGAQLAKTLGVQMMHIPYRGGANAITDVLGGTVPLLITTEQLLVPHESQGKLKTLFITSHQRNPSMPNVPTAREVGLPQLEETDWFGLFVKAGTPPAKVAELRATVTKMVASPAYVQALQAMGYTAPKQQSADFASVLQANRDNWVQRVKLANFQATD